MKHWAFTCLLLALAMESQGHRLDEYLQAVRVAISTNQIDLSIDLTPGVAVSDRLLPLIEIDRNGVISDAEQAAYLDLFFTQARLTCDGNLVPLQIVNSSFPTVEQMKTGIGVIQVKALANIGHLTAGEHTIGLTNDHLPAISAYLVNALVPKDRAIEISAQERDVSQKNYLLRFTVKSEAREVRRNGP